MSQKEAQTIFIIMSHCWVLQNKILFLIRTTPKVWGETINYLNDRSNPVNPDKLSSAGMSLMGDLKKNKKRWL